MEGLAIEASKKDFSAEFNILSAEVKVLSSLDDAIASLLALEKKCRFHNDFSTLKDVCLLILAICRDRNDWDRLISSLSLLNKRRGQSKVAVTAIVEQGLKYLDETPSRAVKETLIKTLMEVCEGKIYVEATDARLHLMLALMAEEDGDVGRACDLIQDIHVETFGSLTKTEKAQYILQQIRLNLNRKDQVRALIQSRKMNRKTLEQDGFVDIKEAFYRLMVEYSSRDRDPLAVSQAFFKIFEARPADSEALEATVIFVILSKYNNEQSDLLARLARLSLKEDQSLLRGLLALFTNREIISRTFPGRSLIEEHSSLLKLGPELAAEYRAMLDDRIIEHNLRVISRSYTRVRLARIAELLALGEGVVEERLAEVAADGDFFVKIHRPAGIVSFDRPREAEEVLSDWGADVKSLLKLLESTAHLIRRENMVHKL